MDSRSNDNYAELPSVETPEDVAVLYSWANLHGAKYRDFSASRREYRAQLRHRAAEQARDTELQAQADADDAEDAAAQAVADVRRAEAEARAAAAASIARQKASRVAEAAAQRPHAERTATARRAEVAAQAQAQLRREVRESAEAHASARRPEALSIESPHLRHNEPANIAEAEVPGSIEDPYTPQTRQPLPQQIDHHPSASAQPHVEPRPQRARPERVFADPYAVEDASTNSGGYDPWRDAPRAASPASPPSLSREPTRSPAPPPIRRPQGYRPDDASGVRQIFRPEGAASSSQQAGKRVPVAHPGRPLPVNRSVPAYASRESSPPQMSLGTAASAAHSLQPGIRERESTQPVRSWTAAPSISAIPAPHATPRRSADPETEPFLSAAPFLERRRAPDEVPPTESELAGETADPAPRRRRQDQPGYRVTDSDRAIAAYRREQGQALPISQLLPSPAPQLAGRQRESGRNAEPVLPAWIEEQGSGTLRIPSTQREYPERGASQEPSPQSPQELSADTLQQSRERVASRWYALKGVFEQPGQEKPDVPPARQRQIRTPVLAVFSFAGGVGKTSLVATLGRSLSSLGEKVLLTDTTSHGLLPFYFGASELRESTVRTFSPPSGSTDAPIYLVNYAVDPTITDEAAQDVLVDKITESGRGAHRMLLDLAAANAWLIRRVAHLAPTVLVPLAPDMNSVISLQAVERFLLGIDGPDGTPLKVFYVLNQFDAGLPLHLDVREVLRRQLGERLLPTVIRRAPAVSEALAEGMTIIDYTADSPVAEDYMNVAHWLRTVAAPATAGFRNVRWSER